MNKLLFLLVIAGLFSPCFAQDSNKMQDSSVTLVISGTIKNFDEFLADVVPDTTYIQLIPMPPDGGIATRWDDKGRVTLQSEESHLVKLPIPKKAAFNFSVHNVLPGKYFIVAQLLSTGWSHPMFLIDKEVKQAFIIDVRADVKSPLVIKAGNLIVWTHK